MSPHWEPTSWRARRPAGSLSRTPPPSGFRPYFHPSC